MELDCAADFGDFDGRVWLNCAHQGPLPRVAAEAAREAVDWKTSPHRLTPERFQDVPARLRRALGRLVGAPAEEIVLANSASYGLHLLANGLPLRRGDEVLLMEGDFPSNLLPWLALEKRGVRVRRLQPAEDLLRPDEVEAALTGASRVLCMSWVHSFSGRTADLAAIGRLCRDRGVRFVVNGSQGVGARPIDVATTPVDALIGVGFKWLCGPYGTGFCWLRPALLASLDYNQAYWLSMQTAEELEGGRGRLAPPAEPGARRYDVFGTANFFNFAAWTASLEYLESHGVDAIAAHDQALVGRLLAGLDRGRYDLLSPETPGERSTLVFLSHHRPCRNRDVLDALRAGGVDVALRAGRLRIAPHLYNTAGQIDRALELLARG